MDLPPFLVPFVALPLAGGRGLPFRAGALGIVDDYSRSPGLPQWGVDLEDRHARAQAGPVLEFFESPLLDLADRLRGDPKLGANPL